jgi:hypothetical protein
VGNHNNINNGNRGGNGRWNHNPQHRAGAPYSNKTTANKFGGSARGESMSNRQTDARQRQQQYSSCGLLAPGAMGESYQVGDDKTGGRSTGSSCCSACSQNKAIVGISEEFLVSPEFLSQGNNCNLSSDQLVIFVLFPFTLRAYGCFLLPNQVPKVSSFGAPSNAKFERGPC